MEIIVLLFLMMLNGFFALSEISLVSVNKNKLEQLASRGSKNAKIAMQLLEQPERFLSAIQVGITLIGVVSGAYGGITLSERFTPVLANITFIAPYAGQVSVVLVVGLITYLSIVIGELVPKTIALNKPEKIVLLVSPVIKIFTAFTSPIVTLLSKSTKLLLRMMFIKPKEGETVSEEELKMMIKLANKQGVLENEESEVLHNLFRLADRRANQLMTHRNEVEWIDVNDSNVEIQQQIKDHAYSKYLVCDTEIDDVVGMVSITDYIDHYLSPNFNIRSIIKKPVYIPENMTALKVLEQFRTNKIYFGVVVDEFGSIQGIMTLHDLAESIFGELPDMADLYEPDIILREDGSWLVDGSIQLDELVDDIPVGEIFSNDRDYNTLGGFVMDRLQKVPRSGDHFTYKGFSFEVVDMDGHRVDKVIIAIVEAA
jgi:putative hemolysin